MIGDPEVGRTDVLFRFTDGHIPENGLALGEDTKTKVISLKDGTKVKLIISDPAGQEKFRHVTSSFYRKAHGVVIVYDVTEESSFNNCEHWLGEVKKYGKSSICKCLVGNRCELPGGKEKRVDLQTAKNWAKKTELIYVWKCLLQMVQM